LQLSADVGLFGIFADAMYTNAQNFSSLSASHEFYQCSKIPHIPNIIYVIDLLLQLGLCTLGFLMFVIILHFYLVSIAVI